LRRLARGYSIHLRNGLRIRQNDDSCIGICQNTYPFRPFVRHEYFLHECSRWAVFDRFETWAISYLGMRRFQANDRTMLMGLLTDVVRSGVFGDHLLAATRRTLYEHRIIIPGRRRLSELAGEAATTVERHALEVIEREIPAATRAQWSAALSQSIGDTHCEFSENPSFFALRTSLKKQELSPRAADTAVRLPDDIFEEKSGQLHGNLTTPKGLLAKSVVVLGATLGWIWMAIAGGGGLSMLIRQGPWPLTNGWFAASSCHERKNPQSDSQTSECSARPY
jgi:hypothetical protein